MKHNRLLRLGFVAASALAATPASADRNFGYVPPATNATQFGTGADGAASISSGNTTLVRDMNYTNLTISGTGRINTGGFRIFVAGTLDISAATTAAIYSPVGTGANATGATAGNGGGAVASGTTPLHGNNGGNGATGGTGAGANSSAQNATMVSYAYQGGQGGGGGTASGGATAGGLAGTIGNIISQPIFSTTEVNPCGWFLGTNCQLYAGGQSPSGGGAGAGDGTSAGGGGGGGGTPGSAIYIYAAFINRGAGTAAGVIQAFGGNGGNGGNAVGGNAGGGGGGGGSTGSAVRIVAGALLGSTVTNAINVSGGAGGTGGNGAGTGKGGQGGAGGGPGAYSVLVLSPPSFAASATGVAAASQGAAPSGTAGTAGTAGVTLSGNL